MTASPTIDIDYFLMPGLNTKTKIGLTGHTTIIEVVCKAYDITTAALKSDSRSHDVLFPRYTIANILFEHKKYDKKKIGTIINRERTSIIHAVKRHEADYAQNEYYKHNYDIILKSLTTGKPITENEIISIKHQSERKEIYGEMGRMKVGDSFECNGSDYRNVLQAVAYASKNKNDFLGFEVKTAQSGNGKYKITRIK